MKKLYRQYNLQRNTMHLTAWLQDGLKTGSAVTLKDSEHPNEWWLIKSMGDTLIGKEELHKKSKWNNNI